MRAWIVAVIIAVGDAVLHYALTDPVLLKQGTKAFSIAMCCAIGIGLLKQLLKSPLQANGASSAQTATASESAPKSAAGGFVTLPVVIITSLIGLGLALLLAGCAPGADGLRQACTNADRTIEGAYQAAGSAYKLDQEKMRAKLTANTITGAQADALLIAHKNIIDKVLAALDGLKASKTALCSAIPAVEAGQRKDTAQLIASVSNIVAAVPPLIEAIAELSAYLDPFILQNPRNRFVIEFGRNSCAYESSIPCNCFKGVCHV